MSELLKYPRTRHLKGSRFQDDDHDLEAVPFEELIGKNLVVEEKLDGSNCGISFSESGELLLQSRGHYLRGGPREREFEFLKQWATAHTGKLHSLLDTGYVLYAENLLALHSVYYDSLPHYLFEFDILERETGKFLSTEQRRELIEISELPIAQVPVLAAGQFGSLEELRSMIRRSLYFSETRAERMANLSQACTDANTQYAQTVARIDQSDIAEGLYVKWEEKGEVLGRYKFVRESFTATILASDDHWHDRPMVRNGLAPGAWDRMFG